MTKSCWTQQAYVTGKDVWLMQVTEKSEEWYILNLETLHLSLFPSEWEMCLQQWNPMKSCQLPCYWRWHDSAIIPPEPKTLDTTKDPLNFLLSGGSVRVQTHCSSRSKHVSYHWATSNPTFYIRWQRNKIEKNKWSIATWSCIWSCSYKVNC